MNLLEAIRSGKPFRRPSWVEPDYKIQWCVLAPDDSRFWACHILWEDGSTFGDIEYDMFFVDDFEIKP